MLSCVCFVCGLGLMNVGWVVLVCGFSVLSLLVEMYSSSFSLKSEWIGTDEVSFILVIMCVMVMMLSLVSSSKEVKDSVMSEIGGFCLPEMVGFLTLSSVVLFQVCGWMDFYFFFEFSLVPVFFMVLKWGYRPERLMAGVSMVIYTVGCSLPLLMGFSWFWVLVGNDNMLLFKMLSVVYGEMNGIFWLLMGMSFFVKLPVYGVHGWLPKAHVEAPLAGSMVLAGVMLKFGGYGMVRFLWFVDIPLASGSLLMLVLSVWGSVLASASCLCQSDIKSLIAYSSISHMGLGLGSLLTFYSLGKEAFSCVMFAHGLCSPILFAMAASSYDVCLSRNVLLAKGLLRVFPLFSGLWYLSCVCNMGVPPFLNFYGEVFCVVSLVWTNFLLGFVSGVCSFVTGCYCFMVYGLFGHGHPPYVLNYCVNLSSRYVFSALFAFSVLFFMVLELDYFLI